VGRLPPDIRISWLLEPALNFDANPSVFKCRNETIKAYKSGLPAMKEIMEASTNTLKETKEVKLLRKKTRARKKPIKLKRDKTRQLVGHHSTTKSDAITGHHLRERSLVSLLDGTNQLG
jgi:hypothetical protein